MTQSAPLPLAIAIGGQSDERLPDAGAGRIASTVEGKRRCPFENPLFYLDVETPCPVCGDLGNDSENSRCVG